MAENEQQLRAGADSLAPKNSGGAAAPAAGGSAPIAPVRRGSVEWVGSGRPLRVPGMDDGGAADAIEDIENRAVALADEAAALFWDGHRNTARAEIRDALAAKLRRVGAAAEAASHAAAEAAEAAARLGQCHRAGGVELMATGALRTRPEYRCKQRRLCPWCARSEAGRRGRRLLGAMTTAHPGRLQFCTLTAPNIPVGRLAVGEAAFWAAWDKLRRRRAWARGAVGSVASMETTWNSATDTFHVHLHVALEARDTWAGGFSWERVQADWAALAGAPVVDFRPLDGPGALLEVTKYVSKLKASKPGAEPGSGGGLLDMPDGAFAEWLAVFARPAHKLWRVYGAWRGVVATVDAADKEARMEARAEREAVEPVARFGWDSKHPGALAMFLHPECVAPVRFIQPYISTDAPPPNGLQAVRAALDLHRQAMQAEALARARRRKRRAEESGKWAERQEARRAASAGAA